MHDVFAEKVAVTLAATTDDVFENYENEIESEHNGKEAQNEVTPIDNSSKLCENDRVAGMQSKQLTLLQSIFSCSFGHATASFLSALFCCHAHSFEQFGNAYACFEKFPGPEVAFIVAYSANVVQNTIN